LNTPDNAQDGLVTRLNNIHTAFSWTRLWALMLKEILQLWRDKGTFIMMIGVPLIQLILFGFAINTNPRHLPVAIVSADHSVFTRNFIKAMENSDYFKFVYPDVTPLQADTLLQQGRVLFVLRVPPDFSRNLVRGKYPQLLIEADGTDPIAVGTASGVIQNLVETTINKEAKGAIAYLQSKPPAFELVSHLRYNPLGITQYNIIPGLLGVVLTSSMTMITAIALTREKERGTMENLLSMPVLPLEVIMGKIIPYIAIGYTQVVVILLAAHYIFHIPIAGNVGLLLLLCLPFIAANLAVGLSFSSLATNQLQAMQSSVFFFLPSILLSGFMFPFLGMPFWAQCIGNILPLTHFVVIIRGILLKNVGLLDLWFHVFAILIFMLCAIMISIVRFRRTLD